MFMDIYNEALSLFKELMGVPEGYEVLFLQGGATLEFSAVPLNLMTVNRTAIISTAAISPTWPPRKQKNTAT
jgi:phosphoserine aminotransferase